MGQECRRILADHLLETIKLQPIFSGIREMRIDQKSIVM